MKTVIVKLLKSIGLFSPAQKTLSWLKARNPFKVSQHKLMVKFYAQFVQAGDLCFDIGANDGNRTEVFLELGGRVICIEPQKSSLERLRQLFGQNPQVTIVPKAASDTEGFATLAVCDDESMISTMSDKWRNEGRFANTFQWSKTEQVPTTTLDKLIEEYGAPKFCKIDVEGFELSVLKGLSKAVIPYLSFEFTREFFDDAEACLQHLASLGAIKVNGSIGESMQLLFPSWVSVDELRSKMKSIPDDHLWGDIYVHFV